MLKFMVLICFLNDFYSNILSYSEWITVIGILSAMFAALIFQVEGHIKFLTAYKVAQGLLLATLVALFLLMFGVKNWGALLMVVILAFFSLSVGISIICPKFLEWSVVRKKDTIAEDISEDLQPGIKTAETGDLFE